MTTLGYFLSCEKFHPTELVRQAVRAEAAGFERLWISDHFHPWNAQQGHSRFVWSVVGALSQVCSLPITTAVICPIMRIHPAVIARAAATCAAELDGRFVLGVGTGEAFNERITGQRWPTPAARQKMLEEAVSVIRKLFTGKQIIHRGSFFTVEQARVYTLPEDPAPIYISAFGPACRPVGRANQGRLPEHHAFAGAGLRIRQGRRSRQAHPGRVQGLPLADQRGRRAHRSQLWRTEELPGELNQTLPTPAHFEQAPSLVPASVVEQSVPCGLEAKPYIDRLDPTNDQMVDERYIIVGRGRDYPDVPPLRGIIYTNSENSVIDVAVDVTPCEGAVLHA